MSHSDHHDRAYETGARRSRRRRRVVAGAVGLAALIGGGAFAATQALTDKSGITAAESGSQSPLSPPAEPLSPSPATHAPVRPSGKPRTASPAPTVIPTTKSVEQQIKDARAAAQAAGVPLLRPLTRPPMASAEVTETNTGSLQKDRRTLRVVSARGDLTGQRELGWVADHGEPFQDVRCSQTVHFTNNTKPSKKPNLLICWRTSESRSVFTVMVDLGGRPSREDSVAALDQRWAELG
jgi:hypothetical protein